MLTRIAALSVAVALSLTLAACADTEGDTAEPPADSEESPGSTQRAPGVYEQPDGTAEVIGTLEYRDIEGGVWLITDPTAPVDSEGSTLMVIANASTYQTELEALEGQPVLAAGTPLDGVSTRMAGPEIEITSIELREDTGGPAD